VVRDPGKTLQSARNFRIGATNQTARETLDLQDRVDIWKVNNKFRGSFDLSLKGIAKKANLDVAILDDAGNVVATSRNRNNKAEQLTTTLETGTYYVQVKLRSGTASPYALTLASTPLADQVGDTFEAATLLRGAAVTDFVGNADPNDYFGIVPLISGQLKLDLTGLSDDANLEIYDSTRSLRSSSLNPGSTPESILQNLTSIAGSPYYLRVFPAPGKETNYTLNYAFTPGKITSSTTGLQYVDLIEGTGATPTKGQKVTVQYTGILTNGTKFDSSRDRNTPFSFNIGLGQVIDGWEEGIASMKVGGRRQLIIPASLGYGTRGQGSIPGNATLIFDVEVLEIL
jgi:FKBP-type peptidyl-prolyl cis-trans isomerase/Bacterial pre-peptidase C-terminal domain